MTKIKNMGLKKISKLHYANHYNYSTNMTPIVSWVDKTKPYYANPHYERTHCISQQCEIRLSLLHLYQQLMNFWLQPAEKQLAATTTELASNNPMRLLPIVAVLIAIVLLLVILAVIFVIIIRGRNNCTNSNR